MTSSHNAEWLSLVEVSGPFLAARTLDDVFPQGLDAYDLDTYRTVKSSYDEWRDSELLYPDKFEAITRQWVRLVLNDALEYGDALVPFDELEPEEREATRATSDLGEGSFTPDYVLRRGNGAEPVLFVKTLPHGVSPSKVDPKDEWRDSPAEKMTRLCRVCGVRVGLVTDGEEWTLVNAPDGSPSGTATWYARLWSLEPETWRAFVMFLGIRRFFNAEPRETLPKLLDASRDNIDEVTTTLGEQVRAAVEVLLQCLSRADADRNHELLEGVSPKELYEAGLTVMLRLVFTLCAEERGLLLYGESDLYDQSYAVSNLRDVLENDGELYGEAVLERRYDAWSRLLGLFRVIHDGSYFEDMRIPPYGGDLFDPDKYPFLEGRPRGSRWNDVPALPLPIDNRSVLLLLRSLQIVEQSGGATKISYRALDVEQIGYVYEGLLEQTAVRTDDVYLGLVGSAKSRNPVMKLSDLEALRDRSEDALFKKVADVTGRGKSAITNAFPGPNRKKYTPNLEVIEKLRFVCGGDAALEERIKPFANWMRLDVWKRPLVYLPGSYMVSLGQDRRDSGTHYTPKILTEKITRRALEPVVYDGPAEGVPREEWRLKSAEDILKLKVCDPAMGSGAFLVQVIRYLGDRLVDAWALAEKDGKRVDANGAVTDREPREPLSNVLDERIVTARRLVAQRCVYGVDINPMAVELAKLSIWLVTVAKGRPFAFLDHCLRAGDSLLGVADIRQIKEFKLHPVGTDAPSSLFVSDAYSSALQGILEERALIRQTTVRDMCDVDDQSSLNDRAQRKSERLRLLADRFVAELLNEKEIAKKRDEKKELKRDDERSRKLSQFASILNDENFHIEEFRTLTRTLLKKDLPEGNPDRRPFHWAIEFPEVFLQGGFDAICGNPPFSGGKHITGVLGTAYRDYLVGVLADGKSGSADLVAYFYLRAFELLKENGVFGLLACNTIAEGDTRQVGLEQLLKRNASIIAADPDMDWPGTASVSVSPVCLIKNAEWNGARVLSGKDVSYISAYLSDRDEWSPKVLNENAKQSFIGSVVIGLGFTMSESEAKALIAKNPQNARVLSPYLIGEDLNRSPEQKPSRWIINFWDWPLNRQAEGSWGNLTREEKDRSIREGSVPRDFPGSVAADFPEILAIVEEKVKPERLSLKINNATTKGYRDYWWLYGRNAKDLYHAIGRGDLFFKHPDGYDADSTYHPQEVLVSSIVTKHFVTTLISGNLVYSCKNVVFLPPVPNIFLSSSIFQDWVWKHSSRMRNDLSFAPSDSYETFPFPMKVSPSFDELESRFYLLRKEIMLSDQIGLTKLYNRFHDENETDARIEKLREMQRELDSLVVEAYGWQDVELDHGFHKVGYLSYENKVRYTICEPARIEILRRLATLNHERYEAQEAAKAAEKEKGNQGRNAK